MAPIASAQSAAYEALMRDLLARAAKRIAAAEQRTTPAATGAGAAEGGRDDAGARSSS